MGAKNFFLSERRWHHVRGILRLLSSKLPSPSLRWLSAEVSRHSGSAQKFFCNFFGKHSAMVLKNLFVSSSDVQATDGAILSCNAFAGHVKPRATFLTANFDHSRVAATLSRVSIKRSGCFCDFEMENLFRRTTLIRETLIQTRLSPWGLHK